MRIAIKKRKEPLTIINQSTQLRNNDALRVFPNKFLGRMSSDRSTTSPGFFTITLTKVLTLLTFSYKKGPKNSSEIQTLMKNTSCLFSEIQTLIKKVLTLAVKYKLSTY